MLLVPALDKQRQEDFCKLQASQGYIMKQSLKKINEPGAGAWSSSLAPVALAENLDLGSSTYIAHNHSQL